MSGEHVWFTADTHFGHQKILKFHPERPGTNAEEMGEALIENWNAVVNKADHIYVVGDFSLSTQEVAENAFRRLKGNKHLVQGNHDPTRVARMSGWQSVSQIKEVKAGNHKFVLCHFPMLTWNGAHRGVYHLHGHSHGMLREQNHLQRARLDVGIDCHPHHRPFHLDEVLSLLGEYTPVDKHDSDGYR